MSYISVAALSSAKSNVAGSRSRPLESDGRLNEKGGGVKRGNLDAPVMVEISDKLGVANKAKEKYVK